MANEARENLPRENAAAIVAALEHRRPLTFAGTPPRACVCSVFRRRATPIFLAAFVFWCCAKAQLPRARLCLFVVALKAAGETIVCACASIKMRHGRLLGSKGRKEECAQAGAAKGAGRNRGSLCG